MPYSRLASRSAVTSFAISQGKTIVAVHILRRSVGDIRNQFHVEHFTILKFRSIIVPIPVAGTVANRVMTSVLKRSQAERGAQIAVYPIRIVRRAKAGRITGKSIFPIREGETVIEAGQ